MRKLSLVITIIFLVWLVLALGLMIFTDYTPSRLNIGLFIVLLIMRCLEEIAEDTL